jgi:hypothetical protein
MYLVDQYLNLIQEQHKVIIEQGKKIAELLNQSIPNHSFGLLVFKNDFSKPDVFYFSEIEVDKKIREFASTGKITVDADFGRGTYIIAPQSIMKFYAEKAVQSGYKYENPKQE